MKWDRHFLRMADLVASVSKDPSTQVGAVIVDAHNRVVSQGYNGFPRGVRDDAELLANRDEKLRRTIHAETNAILFASRSLAGCTIYVTHPPCAKCAAKIIQTGIARVVCPPPADTFAERWADDMASAMAMFVEAGVEYDFFIQGAM